MEVFLFIFLCFIYFIPTINAASNHKKNGGAVFVINLFLGWTFLGWVIALAMSCGSERVKD